MTRPKIKDLAVAAGVSVSTVNRVISGAGTVRKPTRERVLHAADSIGFYGLGTIKDSIARNRETHRLGVLLLQRHRSFYQDLGAALQKAADAFEGGKIELVLENLSELSPETVAQRLLELGKICDAVALVAAEHPLISNAIDQLIDDGVPVLSLLSPLSAKNSVGYVGLDAWKAGRTAAWAIEKMCTLPGEVGILVGNYRFRNQELSESGFRSYFREHNAAFTLLEPRLTYESSDVARELTAELFNSYPDMCGFFVCGGGVSGFLAAMKDQPPRENFVSVAFDLTTATRSALIDGSLTMVLSHPLETLARQALTALVDCKRKGQSSGVQNVSLGFEIFTSENV